MLRHFNDARNTEELHDAFGISALMPVPSRKRKQRIARQLLGRSFADLTITVANITPSSAAVQSAAGITNQYTGGTAGETLTQGLLVYRKASDGLIYKADNNDVTDSPVGEVATILGITMNSALTGQPVSIMTTGLLEMGAILTKGTTYILSSTAGAIAPDADYGSGKYKSVFGYGYTTARMWVQIFNTGLKSA